MNGESRTKKELLEEIEILKRRLSEPDGSDKSRYKENQNISNEDEGCQVMCELTEKYTYTVRFLSDGDIHEEPSYNVIKSLLGFNIQEIKSRGGWQGIIYHEDQDYVHDFWESLRSGKHKTAEYRVVSKMGDIRWVRDHACCVWDRKRQALVLIYGAVEDISETKNIEEELLRIKRINDNANYGILITDLKGKIIYVNSYFASIHGYSTEEVIGKSMGIFYSREQLKALDVLNQRVKESGEYSAQEIWHRKSDGEVFPMLMNCIMIKDNNGNPLFNATTAIDISILKHAESSKRESEEKFRSVAEKSPSMIFINQKGKVVFANDICEKILGYTSEELCDEGFDFMKIIAPESKEYVMQKFSQHMKFSEIAPYEYQLVTKSGKKIDAINSTRLINYEGEQAILGVVTDITQQKRAGAALKESEERFHQIAGVIPSVFLMITPDMKRVLYVSPAYEKVWGRKVKFLYKHPMEWIEAVHGEDRERLLSRIKGGNGEEGQPESGDDEYRIVRPDGTERWICGKIFHIHDNEGKVYRLCLNVEDITERREAREALSTSEERFRRIFEDGPLGMFILHPDLTCVSVNNQAKKMLGYDKDEVDSIDFLKIMHPDDFDGESRMKIGGLLKGKLPYLKKEIRFFTKNGRMIWTLITGFVVRKSGGEPIYIMGMFEDITNKKRMDEELIKSEKLESLGILAGGIAHDFNNILTSVLGGISLALTDIDPASQVASTLQDTLKAVVRARDLTYQLLTFSKGGAPVLQTASIKGILKDTARFAVAGSNIKCSFSLPADLWAANIDEGQISQVINNLVINAVQAMPSGGILEIYAENADISEDEIIGITGGKYIRITIRDHGEGIVKDDLSKIFDPFFTTKPKGTGLGLAISYSIIKRHAGTIIANSVIGEGTSFTIFLPAVEEFFPDKADQLNTLKKGEGKILVMDDDDLVRETAGNILEILGFEVRYACNGEEAVKLYEEASVSEEPFKAVVMDLTVPGGMGGVEAVRHLKSIDPYVKAIVSSGYSNDKVIANFKEYGFVGCLKKPYIVEEMSRVINEVFADV